MHCTGSFIENERFLGLTGKFKISMKHLVVAESKGVFTSKTMQYVNEKPELT